MEEQALINRLLSILLLTMLFLACLVYVQDYVDEVQSNPNITATTKAFVRFIPALLVLTILVLSGTGIYIALTGRRS